MSLQTNPQLELASEYIRETSTHVFLTGKAGSGKTTFLRQVREHGNKRMVVVAPTGVAAINAGGMTIHSLFQLPFGLHLPDMQRSEPPRKYSRQKLSLIRSLELLVIDEISMVRADLLDAVDEALRRFRGDDRPFGNVQLLMIGDLHQLPPVVKQEDWESLERYYETPYFFGSLALKKTEYVSIELKHIYRQSDTTFIDLLNKVRDNCLDEATLRTLNSRYIPNFQPPPKQPYITLTATNAVALDINSRNLADLAGKSHCFSAKIEGDFPESFYPTEEELEFKLGAQVMFIKNDLQPEKQYFNGKIGRIVAIDDEVISVRCEGDASDISVTPVEWQNIKYALNETTKEIEEQVLGKFIQHPLKFAWAITIHKSQGLTFERAIIDAQAAFAHGQVYVALSRCKSFEGIVLRSMIDYRSVKTDPVVRNFSAEAERNVPTATEVAQAKHRYQRSLIEQLFNFETIDQCFNRLQRTYQENQSSLGVQSYSQLNDLKKQAYESLTAISTKFHPQLLAYFDDEWLPEAHPVLRERIVKASGYFTEKIAGFIKQVSALPKQTDNQALRQAVSSQADRLQQQLFIKQASIAACQNGFSTAVYKRAQLDADLDYQRQFTKRSDEETVPEGMPNPKLYEQLLQYRRQMADKHGVGPRAVLTSESLRQLVTILPRSQEAISKIHGIAKKRLARYGQDIESMIVKYCRENSPQPDKESAGKQSPGVSGSGTQQTSYTMFQAGKSVEEIAKERSLSITTVQGHLGHYVEENQLDIRRLLPQPQIDEIDQYCEANPTATLSSAREYFGTKYSYGELRLVFAFRSSREA